MAQERLTNSELACVRAAGNGLSDKEIARRLGIPSHRTVQRHLSEAYRKLEVRDRNSAAAVVLRDYADLPIRMSDLDAVRRSRGGPGASPGDEALDSRPWLARVWRPPPRSRLVILSLILGWAILALALILGGVGVTGTVFAALEGVARSSR